ncbi:hypothetical protein BST61_g1762 [Cercospora zeina]
MRPSTLSSAAALAAHVMAAPQLVIEIVTEGRVSALPNDTARTTEADLQPKGSETTLSSAAATGLPVSKREVDDPVVEAISTLLGRLTEHHGHKTMPSKTSVAPITLGVISSEPATTSPSTWPPKSVWMGAIEYECGQKSCPYSSWIVAVSDLSTMGLSLTPQSAASTPSIVEPAPIEPANDAPPASTITAAPSFPVVVARDAALGGPSPDRQPPIPQAPDVRVVPGAPVRALTCGIQGCFYVDDGSKFAKRAANEKVRDQDPSSR